MTMQSKNTVITDENGYQRRRRETRAALMEAGLALFVARAVEQVSIESITASAGVAKGSFYNHFESREALFEELIGVTVASLLEQYAAFDPAIEDPLANALARAHFAFYTLLSDPAACRLLLQGGHPAQGGAVDRVLRLGLGDALNEAVALGSLSHVDPELVYAAYFGVITGTVGHLLTKEGELNPRAAADQLTEVCFAVLGLPHDLPGEKQEEVSL